MINISKISLMSIICGIAIMGGSFIRYFILWPDPDKAIMYPLIGFLYIFAGLVYHWELQSRKRDKKLKEEINNVGDGLQDLMNECRGVK